ncbi:MAG: hypothetical protein ABJF10_13185 [Chthoniobacter sp.]|uniref:hypothetical protein n=1 Tax=Chthoniobacter sp. TaxID=2510640 RepID=UPI0032AE2B3C
MIGQVINAVLKRFDRRLQCASTYHLVEQKRLALQELFTLAGSSEDEPVTLEGIVFSKDRPTQLHALLDSYRRHAADPVPLHVIYKATTSAHEAAYREVFACFDSALVRPVPQGVFKDDLVKLLGGLKCSRIVFLVDDIIFIEPFAFADLLSFDPLRFIPTLRLGCGLTECYTRSKPQIEPPYLPGITTDPRLVVWRWKDGEHDYGFPLSVDGQIYSRREIAVIARYGEFRAPNTFENALQVYNEEFAGRYAVAYKKARLVNVPLNRVQEEWDSRHAGLHEDKLLESWHQGLRWDVAALDGYRNRSTHEEVEVQLVPR